MIENIGEEIKRKIKKEGEIIIDANKKEIFRNKLLENLLASTSWRCYTNYYPTK